MHINPPGVPIPSTQPAMVLSGCFGMHKWRVPYFATTLSLKDAADSLHTASDLPGADRIKWKLEELYQRDIDWPRVENQIQPYLRNPNQPQFFNSITIALLPYQPDSGLVQDFSEDYDWHPPEMTGNGFDSQLRIGPISFGFYGEAPFPDVPPPVGAIQWNKDEVYGVAIDGQHRLAAIKRIVDGLANSEKLRRATIPVIFLLFDERVGFQSPHSVATVELLRRLFIDLNKHAKTVSRSRQLLLDDRDPHARCVRSLLAEALSDDIEELRNTPPRLPLSLADWHSDQAKFDQGPYLSTVLGLDGIVSTMLNTKPIADFTDYSAVSRTLTQLETGLQIDLSSARASVKDLEDFRQVPFTYSESDLEAISDAFGHRWNPAIIRVLTQYQPYAELIEQRARLDTFTLTWQNWFRLFALQQSGGAQANQEYLEFRDEMQSAAENPLSESRAREALQEIEELKNSLGFAYTVVFQKALFLALRTLVQLGSSFNEDLRSHVSDDDDIVPVWSSGADSASSEEISLSQPDDAHQPESVRELRADEFVAMLNDVFTAESGLLEVDAIVPSDEGSTSFFWSGSLRKPEGSIDFTQAAAKRAKDLLVVIAALSVIKSTENDFDAAIAGLTQDNAPSSVRSVQLALNRQTGEEGIGGRILKAAEKDYDSGAARVAVLKRLEHAWDLLD